MKPAILVVDDEPSFRSVIIELLAGSGYAVTGAGSGEEALCLLERCRYDVVFSDLRMPGIDGLALLSEIKKREPSVEVVMITNHTSVSSAIEALRLGAYDYLIKPLDDIEQVLAIVKRVSEKLSLSAEKQQLLKDLRLKNQELEKKHRELEDSHQRTIQYSEDISALYAAEKEILAGLDLSEVYQRSVTCLSKLLSLRPAALWILPESGDLLLLAARSEREGNTYLKDRISLSEPLNWSSSNVPTSLKALLNSSISAKSALFHPIVSHRRLLGFLCVCDSERKAFTKREEEILSRFSVSIALAIENARLYEKVKAMAIRDGLTGLYNRRHFEAALNAEILRALRYHDPVSLIFLDVDYFKNYNDSQGHLKGDELLKELAGLVLKRIRATDIVCRYGGEEFTIILPSTNKERAKTVAQDIRARVEAHPFPNRIDQPAGMVTISLGISECPADGKSSVEIIKRADEALYRAKQAGRNRIC